MSDSPDPITRPVRFHGERSRWLVQSDSQPDYPVLVDMDDEEFGQWCACEDWHFRQKEKGPGYKCKHILAVLAEMALIDKSRQPLKLSDIKPQMRVGYVPAHSAWDHSAVEFGTVSSKNGKYVFVKFDKQLEKFGWEGTTSQSCNPNDLYLA